MLPSAQITGDRNPLHFDPDFAKRTRFGRLVAQGGIAAGMLNALVAMDLPGAGTVFMSQSLRYLAPTYLGDTLTAEVEVLSLDAPGRARSGQLFASSCSFNTRRRILPDGVLGIASTNSTSPGTL
jgi:acyl dehydratase